MKEIKVPMKRIKLNKTVRLKNNADPDVAKAIFNVIKKVLPGDLAKQLTVKDIKVATVPSGDKKYMVSFMVGPDDIAEGYADITVTDKPSNKFELKVKTMLVNACDQSSPVEPKAQFDPPASTPADPEPMLAIPNHPGVTGQPLSPPTCQGPDEVRKQMRLRERLVQKVLNPQEPSEAESEPEHKQAAPSNIDVKFVDALIKVLQKVKEQMMADLVNNKQSEQATSLQNPEMRDAVKRVLYRIVNSL